MSEKKKKNTPLPDDVVYINPANRAFVNGETKELANKDEVFRNIAWKAGSSNIFDLHTRLGTAIVTFILGLIPFSISVYFLTYTPIPESKIIEVICGGTILLFIGFVGVCYIYESIRTLIYRPQKIRELYTDFVQHGKIYEGKLIDGSIRGKLKYEFRSPISNTIRGKYQMNDYVSSTLPLTGDSVVILYLDDKRHILL